MRVACQQKVGRLSQPTVREQLGDFAFATYGSDEHIESISETIPELEVKVRTTNNITMPHLVLRAQPREGKVRPYADALVGFKYL